MLSSNDIRQVLFTTTSSEEGYDPTQVQSFLDKVAQTLSRLESGHTSTADGKRLLEPQQLLQQRFLGTKFRNGYAVDEVDDLLNKASDTLNEYVRMAIAGTLPSPTNKPAATTPKPAARVAKAVAKPEEPIALGTGPAATGWLRDDVVPSKEVPTQVVPTHTVSTRNPMPTPRADSATSDPVPKGMRGGDVLRELQYTRATMFGDARETLTVRTPDGNVFGVASIERTDDGVIVHLA